jgi:hypothetical protein
MGALATGSDVAQSGIQNETSDKPSNKLIGALTIGGLLLLLVAIAIGIGAAIGLLGLAVLTVGIVAVIRGGAAWARIASKRAAVAVAVAGCVATGVGGAMTPEPKTDNTASEAATPTSSAGPATTAPTTAPSSSAAKPLVAAPVTTSAAPVLPPAPTMVMTCPTGGSVASPVYGRQIAATAPYTVTINYGDGDEYINDDQNLPAIFSHTYKAAGTFTVSAVLTDAVGQTTSATCTYTWTKPVVVAPPVKPSPGGSSSGGVGFVDTGAQTGDGTVYQNCDAVRAAGAAPIHPGDPGFQPKFDRDNDGIGCE